MYKMLSVSAINKNEFYTVDINGMTHEGFGVGKIKNFAVFIEGALPGETVETKIIKVNKNFAVGKLINIIKPSKNRREPFCGVYKRCGGCDLQHMDYSASLEFKTGVVRDSIKRIGKLENVLVHDMIGMKDPVNYRNKAQYPVVMRKNSPVIGFYSKRSHEVIESSVCHLQDSMSDMAKAAVKDFIVENGISIYDEATGKGLLRHILVRKGFNTGEVMVVLIINGHDIPQREKLVDMLVERIPSVKSIMLNINTKRTNVITGVKNITLYGEDKIFERIGKYKFGISPVSFFQVNSVQTEVLYGKVMQYATLSGNETVIDLYSGTGTISIFLSEKAKKVYGIEIIESAVKDARENAAMNRIENVEFISGNAGDEITKLYNKGIEADVVILDPPRKGCDAAVLDTVSKMQVQRVIYVSCNPATLARDIAYLNKKGYAALEVQPVDMFPWTTHVECVIRIQREE